jgi:diguanylate cyclase (GGDEF)-like protein
MSGSQTPGPPEPSYPTDAGILGEFVAGSTSMLLGRLDRSATVAGDGGLLVVAANPALARWLEGPCPVPLSHLLSVTSLERILGVVEKLRGGAKPPIISLRFIAATLGQQGPTTKRRSRVFRCLVTPDQSGTIWLVGEPRIRARRAGRVSDGSEGEVRELQAALARANRRRRALASTDPLTGLANRRRAEHLLARLVEQARPSAAPLACVLVDLDHFKAVNDTYGHAAGDVVLKAAAEALSGSIRASDRIARFGGEEFMVLLPGTDRAGALIVAERIRTRLAECPITVPGLASAGLELSNLTLTASIGVAERVRGEPPARLLARADAALLRAKRAGRDRVESDPEENP